MKTPKSVIIIIYGKCPKFVFLGGLMTLLETLFPEFYVNPQTSYDIVKQSDSELLLEFLVPGASESDVDIEVVGNTLTVRVDSKDERNYLHKSIPRKSFVKKLTLRDDIHVKGAAIKNGILSVQLEIEVPEDKKPRKILLAH